MSRRIAWLGAAVLLPLSACANILQFDDLRTWAGDDASLDSAAEDATVPDVRAEASDAHAPIDSGGLDASHDASDADAPVDAGADQDCPGTRCGSAGQCVDTQSDPSHCGSCGVACPSGGSCVGGACKCPSAQSTSCGNACVDTATDHGNCGGCGNVCQAGYRCSMSACILCLSTDKMCSGVCADLSTDLSNCGSCGNHCPSGAVCQGGACGCPGGTPTVCAGAADAGQQCVNLTNDHNNCGGCGNQCNLAHATSFCSGSSCAVAVCTLGNADCDKVASTGCEVSTTGDPNNCGRCGNVCNLAHTTPTCNAGSCAASTCSPGYTDCDLLAANGCEVNTAADPNNCGRCGNVCNLAHATAGCSAGVCTIASCNAGFKDCDGNVSNGCETNLTLAATCGDCQRACNGGTPLCSSSTCVSGCPTMDPTLCNGTSCVNTTNDPNNCGACSNVCTLPNATATCNNSSCAIGSGSCNPGFSDCDRVAANGCEIHTSSDLSNCGTCGRACTTPNATPVCSNSSCAISSCNTGFADCDMLVANGCEVNTTNDPNHCGGCGSANVCTGGKTCQSSTCACPAGMHDCGGTCVSNTSTSSCGTMCAACTPPSNGVATCSAGSCGLACTSDAAHPNLCGTKCVNFTNDPGNCGMCNKACLVGGNCSSSACVCPTGSIGCPTGPTATTCVNISGSDNNNCGGCGTACTGGKSCQAGTCVCPAGSHDCSGTCSSNMATSSCGTLCSACPSPTNFTPTCDGTNCGGSCNTMGFTACPTVNPTACVNLATDSSNCSACGASCSGGKTCQTSTCACPAGSHDCSGTCSSNTATGSCGTLCTACPTPTGGTPTCDGTNCGGSCSAMGFTACPTVNPTACVNLATDSSNCGACGAPCSGGKTCQTSTCACPAGSHDCSGTCSSNTSTSSCGTLCTACPTPTGGTPTCDGTNCGGSCTTMGFTACPAINPTACVDTSSDPNNCGGCGNPCVAPTPNCVLGVCGP